MTLEVVFLIVLTHRRQISLFVAFPWSVALRSVTGLARDFVPLLAGTALGSTSPLVDQAFASAVGPGSIATLSYANRITALGMGIGISSIGLIALPHFSELAARNAWGEMRTLLCKLATATFLLGLPVAIGISVLSEPLIRVVFERGRFVSSDTATVASLQTLFAVQIPFHLTGIVGVRALNALRANRTIMLIVIWNVVSNFGGDFLFLKLFGLRGIALATSFTYMISCAAILTFALIELGRRARSSSLEKL